MLPKNLVKNRPMSLRVTKEEHAIIRKAAKYTNSRSIGDFIRKHLIYYIDTILLPKKQ